MNSTVKSLIFWIVVILMVVLLWQSFQSGARQPPAITFTDFLTAVEEGRVDRVTLRGDEIRGSFKATDESGGGDEFRCFAPDYPGLIDKLRDTGVTIQAEPARENPLLAIFLTWGPVLLIVGLWIFFMRHFRSRGQSALSPLQDEGRRQGEVRLLNRQLEHRYGDVPDWAMSLLEEAGPEQLERWGERILDTNRLEDVFDKR